MLVFNVENLFDIDGIAMFDDYQMEPGDPNKTPYSPTLLRKKLDFIVTTLLAVDEGKGPDIVLFQEFERDRTPRSSIRDPLEFLEKWKRDTLDSMLANPNDWVTGLPTHAFLLKALADSGLVYPYMALAEEDRLNEESKAHINAVFSRFPVVDIGTFPTQDAREVVVVELDVEGRSFTVINNHWKSGASRPDTEPSRVMNARTVRKVLDQILEEDPRADVMVGGDLNSYYNQSLLFPGMRETGINTILRSQGDELAVARGERDMYNLWFELPISQRFSEVWRDMKGTLMHIIIAPGLYDDRGIRYIDNSFERILIPEINLDEWGRPIRFRFEGGGMGGSDHLPILARFETVNGDGSKIMELSDPGREEEQPDRILMVDYNIEAGGPMPKPFDSLLGLNSEQLDQLVGEFFEVKGEWTSWNPPTVSSGDLQWEFYSPSDTVWSRMGDVSLGDPVHFYAEFGKWSGEYQWIVRDPSWLMVGRRGLEPRTN